MCFYRDGSSDVWNESIPRARKEHRCDECGRVIPRGDRYTRARSLYDGGWSTWICCARCHFVRALIEQAEITEGCVGNEAVPDIGDLANIWREGEYADRLGLMVQDEDGDTGDLRPMDLDEVPQW
jgi:hypothetical protein